MAETAAGTVAWRGERLKGLAAFELALRREVHVLGERPDILWQQLYNRLQWEDGPVQPVIGRALGQRPLSAGPWLKARTPFRESSALICTMVCDEGPVLALACSPDGKRILSGDLEGKLKLWDTSGTELGRPAVHRGGVVACAFSPREPVFVSVSGDYDVLRWWDAVSGAELPPLGGPSGFLSVCAFTPDGSTLVSTDGHDRLAIWDVAGGAELRKLGGPEPGACAVSPDGSLVASAHGLTLWNVADGTQLRTLSDSSATACAFSPDGSTLLSASGDRLTIWDVATGAKLRTLSDDRHSGKYFQSIVAIKACAFGPDGTAVVAGNEDGTLTLWDPRDGVRLGSLIGHSKKVTACAFSPDGSIVISGSHDGTIKLWDPTRAEDQVVPHGHIDRVRACAFRPDGTATLSVSRNGVLKFSDATNGSGQPSPAKDIGLIKACALSPDTSVLVSADSDRSLKLWDAVTGVELQTLWDDGFLARYNKEDRCLSEKTGGDVTFCAFSPDGAVIVALGGGVRWWEAASGAELKSSRGMYASSACAFSPDGSSLVAANGGDLTIWNGATGAELRTLADAYVSEYYTGVKDCAFSADGSMIASVVGRDEDVLELRGASYRSYSAMLWDAATGRRLATLKSHTRGFNACAFSADGRLLATVCDDGMLEIWNCETKSEFCLFPLLGGGTCVAWHPWLPRLVCGDASGCVYLIDVVGVELAPVVVTAWLREDQTDLHCPACREEFPFEQSMLGQEITCPQPGCGQRLRVNSFVARPLKMRGSLRNAASRLAFWKH